MRFGVVNLLRSARDEVEVARACEAGGFWGLGLGDTAPHLYQDTYATAGACFQATERLRIGPTVTNIVTRHWSILGATARTFDELAPGRFFAGIGTGDGAVHSVGLAPATWASVESAIENIRTIAPPGLEVHVAASGPRGVEAAGRVASDLMLGTGLDVDAIRALTDRAHVARAAAGITEPLRTWAFVNTFVAPDTATAAAARVEQQARANTYARFAFASTFEEKAVPERWQPILRERFESYDFGSHAVGGRNPNTVLFEDHPDLQDYLIDRMLLIGTAEECSSRLRAVAADAGLAGVWLALTPMALEEDPIRMVRTAGDAFADLMTT